MVNSRIDKADLDAEMTVVRSELEGGENNPGRLLWQAVVSTAFHAHPYQWPVIGWRSDVENIRRDAIYQLLQDLLRPEQRRRRSSSVTSGRRGAPAGPEAFRPDQAIPKPPRSTPSSRPSAASAASRPARGVPADGDGRVEGPGGAITRTATRSTCLPGCSARDGQAGCTRRSSRRAWRRAPTPASPSLRDPFLFYVSATARPGVTAERLEAALLEEVERVAAAPDHRRGARRGRSAAPRRSSSSRRAA